MAKGMRGNRVLPQNLILLDRLLADVRRLAKLEPPTRTDLKEALEQVEVLRNLARTGGSVDLAAQLSAVAACIRAPVQDPSQARDPLLEAREHLTVLRRDYAA